MYSSSKIIAKTFFLLLTLAFLFSSCTSVQEPTSTTSAPSPKITGNVQIAYLNVGQGDSTFIQLPTGETVLIDAGEEDDGQTVIQYIKNSGCVTIDYLIATHPHADHIGGMADVINAFTIKKIFMPQVSHTTKTYENLLTTIQAKGLTIQSAKAGKVLFDYGNLSAVFLSPCKADSADLNNSSAVLKLSYNDKSFLFMGDAEREAEEELLSGGFSLAADVLKVGHHGSDTSTTRAFAEAVRPSIAIISVGENSYGHPAPAVLAALQAVGAEIWRTDEKGAAVVTFDGATLALEQMEDIRSHAPFVDSETIVYITNSGTKYHRNGCRYLNKSKIPIPLNEIDTTKYAPCSVCKPPQKERTKK